jgi:cytidine deaminase
VTIGDLLPFTFIETGPGASDIVSIATEVNSTHVTVEWDEPDTPNGIVRQYIISYNLSESDDITLTGSARTVTIGDLLPFTLLPFTVL